MILIANIIIAGFTGIIAQTLLIRELVNVCSGNVFSLGVILASWLFWVALGSYLSGRFSSLINRQIHLYILDQLVICLALPSTILFVRSVRWLFHLMPGEILGLNSLLLLAPAALFLLAFLVGWQFTLACQILPQVAKVYRADVAGSLAGGAVFSFLLVQVLSPLAIVIMVIAINVFFLVILWYFSEARNQKGLFQVLLLALVLILGLGFSRVSTLEEAGSQRLNWTGYQLLQTEHSKYADYALVADGDLNNIYINGVLSYTYPDKINSEFLTHLAMLETPRPDRVLVLGGGFNGIIRQLLKYPVQQIDYVELDGSLLRLAYTYLGEPDKIALHDFRVNLVAADGRRYIREYRGRKFDTVLVNTGNPLTAEANRFYTLEFFQSLKQIMTANGVVVLGVDSNENYLSQEMRNFNGCIYWTLKKVFPAVVSVPGETLYLVGAQRDTFLTAEAGLLLQRLTQRGIATDTFAAILPFRLQPERQRFIAANLSNFPPRRLNLDFAPITYYHHLIIWGKQFQSLWPKLFWAAGQWSWWRWLFVFLLLELIWWGFAGRGEPVVWGTQVFGAGFAGMAAEMVLILSFQVLVGYVYHLLGLVIACFMLGLILGAAYSGRMRSLWLQLGLFALFLAAIPAIVHLVASRSSSTMSLITIIILLVADGFWVGEIFTLTCLRFNRPGLLYSLDLLGACCGTLLVSIMVVPLLGMTATCFALGAMVLINAGGGWYFSRRLGKKVDS